MHLFQTDDDSPMRLPAFRLYVGALVLGTLAIQIQTVTIAWQVFDITKSNHANAALALGAVGLAEVIPFVSSVLFAGHVADKNNRRFIACTSLTVMLLLSLLLFLPSLIATSWLKLCLLYGVVIGGGLARSFLTTARQAMIAEILQRSQIPSAVRWRNTLFELSSVIGPGFAGLLIWLNGEYLAYSVSSILFIAALLNNLSIKTSHELQSRQSEPILQSLRTGIHFMLSQRAMLGAFTLDLFAVLFGGAVALLPIFAEMLNVGPLGFGLLRAATSCGAVIMSIFLLFRPSFQHVGRSLYGSFAIFGLCIIGFGLSIEIANALGLSLQAAFIFSFLFLFISGAADAVNVIIRQTILQTSVPPEMMGRVSAVTAVFIGCSNELGMAESGLAARLLGTVNSVVFGGLAVFGVMGLVHWRFPEISRLEKFH